MADGDDGGIFGPKDFSKTVKSTEKVTESLEGLESPLTKANKAAQGLAKTLSDNAAAAQKYSQTIVPATEKTKNFEDRAKRAAAETQTFNEKLKAASIELAKSADEALGGAHAVRQLKGAVSGAVNEFKKLTSISATYNRHLKALRTGQDLYTKSLLTHTGMQDKASKGLQKTINLEWKQYEISNKLQNKYLIASEEIIKIQEAGKKQFITQIQSYKDSGKALENLTEDAVLMTRRLGIDAPKYMSILNDRMRATNMTMKQAQTETLLVAKAYDTYLKELHKAPEALKRANITQQDWVATMREANEEFKFGAFNAGAFAMALAPLQKIGREAGLNTEEIKSMNSGLVKLMGSLQDTRLKDIFGIQSAGDIMNRIDEFAEAGNENVKRRMKFVSEGLKKGTLNEVQALREILQAAKGDPRLMSMVLKKFSDLPAQIRNEMIQNDANLKKNPMAARLLAENLGPGSAFQAKLQEMIDDPKKAAEVANEYREAQKKLAEKSLTPTERTFKFTAKIAKWLDQAMNWLKKNLWVSIAAAAAGIGVLAAKSVVQILQLRAIHMAIMTRGVGGGGLGGGRGGAGVPTGVGATRATRTYGAGRTAIAAGAARRGVPLTGAGRAAGRGLMGRMGGAAGMARGMVGVGALISVAAGIQKGLTTKGNVEAKLEAGAKTAGEGMLNTVTFGLYSALGPSVTKAIVSLASDEFKRKLGKDKSFARVVAESGVGEALFGGARTEKQAKILKQMDEQRRTRRAALTKQEVLLYKQLQARVKLGETLNEKQKEFLKVNKRDMELREKSVKVAKADVEARQYAAVAKGLGKLDVEKIRKIKDPKQRARLVAREMMGGSEALTARLGGREAIMGMLTGKGGTAAQRALTEKRMMQLGVSKERMAEVLPSELKAAYIRQVAEGRGTKGVEARVTQEQVAAYKAMMKRRERKGITADSFVTSAAIAAGKRTGTGQEMKISVDPSAAGGGADILPQEGKYNQVDGTMTYTVGTTLKFAIGNLIKGIDQSRSDMVPGSNTSKV